MSNEMPEWVREAKRWMMADLRNRLKAQQELERHARRNSSLLARDIMDLRRELGE
jgi:hypothetical protein